MSTVATLREYFVSQNAKAADLEEDTSLLERGLLDSMAIVKLISFLEEQFGVELSDDEFDPDNFETLATIATFVERKKSGG